MFVTNTQRVLEQPTATETDELDVDAEIASVGGDEEQPVEEAQEEPQPAVAAAPQKTQPKEQKVDVGFEKFDAFVFDVVQNRVAKDEPEFEKALFRMKLGTRCRKSCDFTCFQGHWRKYVNACGPRVKPKKMLICSSWC